MIDSRPEYDEGPEFYMFKGNLESRLVESSCECGGTEHIDVGWEDGARVFLCCGCGAVRLLKVQGHEQPRECG